MTLAGALEKTGEWLRELTADGKLAMASLSLGLGASFSDEFSSDTEAHSYNIYAAPEVSMLSESSPPTETPASEEFGESEERERSVSPEIKATTIYGGLTISNATGFSPNIPALMAEGWSGSLPPDGPQILIIHTHGSEAYTPDTNSVYAESDTARTQDKNYNVVRVGDELGSSLEKYGLNVLHDREIYDYPSYSDSYKRSMAAIERHLAENPAIAIVIDLHRDALGSNEVVYKTVADIEGDSSSQLMMLVGTGENGLSHPNWEENLRLALTLQSAINQKYPTLARPVALKQERYNQHLTTGSMILEVGSSGNTLSEALCAVRLYADAIAPLLSKLITN